MANPSTNFGWQMPTNTDLVKDLPADFEVFGQAVDTDLADLKGGTTGQVLSKTSGTDLDFTWITPTDQTPLTTKGDLFGYSTADARIPVGADGTVLTADSAEALGVKWAAPAGGKILQVVSATYSTETTSSSSTFADTGLSATITPSSASSTILVLVSHNGIGKFSGNTQAQFRLLRGATTILNFESFAGHTANTDANFIGGVSAAYVDSPATTSATTYKTQFNSQANIGTVKIQDNNSPGSAATIVLMEVGA